MTPTDLSADWPALFPSLKARFPELTDDILIGIDADRAHLEAEIAKRHGMTPADAREAVADWMQGPMPADAFAHSTHDNAAVEASGAYVPAGEDPSDDDARFGDDGKLENPAQRITG